MRIVYVTFWFHTITSIYVFASQSTYGCRTEKPISCALLHCNENIVDRDNNAEDDDNLDETQNCEQQARICRIIFIKESIDNIACKYIFK